MYQVLIVGNGIAGLALAWCLDRRGVQVSLIADPSTARSTSAAAGVVNPVTGKRYAKSWRFEEHRKAALEFYSDLEQCFGIPIWRERSIARLLGSAEEANNWSQRAGMPEFSDFISDAVDAGPWAPFVGSGDYFGMIRQSAQVDFTALTEQLVGYFREKSRFYTEKYHFDRIEEDVYRYDAIIFCEGAAAAGNPYFPDIPWKPAKGEGLLVEFQDAQLNRLLSEAEPNAPMPMLKKEIVIAAPGYHWNRLCWVGATYSWDMADHHPTQAMETSLITSLQNIVKTPFVVKGRFAGIRQVAKDRRPVLGASNLNPRVFIFNGLGSKGGLQAPLWAAQLADHILDGAPLDPEADIARFH